MSVINQLKNIGFFLTKPKVKVLRTLLKNSKITFCLSRPKIRAKNTSAYLSLLPKDGLLVEGLIAYPIAYLTDKRVIVLPHPPHPYIAKEQVDLSIAKFNLNYAIFSELYKTELHLGYPAIDYVKSFKLIKTIAEDNDIYYIYEIERNNSES
jgi:hypothetical protein